MRGDNQRRVPARAPAGATCGASLGPDEMETGSVIHEPQRVTDRPAHTSVSRSLRVCVASLRTPRGARARVSQGHRACSARACAVCSVTLLSELEFIGSGFCVVCDEVAEAII